jgi:hypothetical protein
MSHFGDSKPFAPNGTQEWSIKKLNEMRDEFIHFLPKSWTIELSGMPSIVEDCLNIIDFLVNESGNIDLPHNESDFQINVSTLVEKIRLQMQDIKVALSKEAS